MNSQVPNALAQYATVTSAGSLNSVNVSSVLCRRGPVAVIKVAGLDGRSLMTYS